MTEEKKEEAKQAPEAPKQAEEKPVEAVSTGPVAQAAEPAKEEKTVPTPEVKRERPANCEGCKKSIKNKRWYYRNGKYFCTKRCWSTTDKKSAKTQEAPAS